MKNKKHQLELLLQRIESAEQQRRAKHEEHWREHYRRYRFRPEGKRAGSNIFVPYTYMLCAVIAARIKSSLFANRPYVTALPREDADAAQATLIQSLIDWQLNDRIKLAQVVGEDVIQSLVVYGTAITYTGWRVQTRKTKRSQMVEAPLTGPDGLPLFDEAGQIIVLPQHEVVEDEQTIYDDPIVQCVDLFDFYVDPFAADIESARYCGHKEYQTRAQLEALVEQDKYKINWKELEAESEIDRPAQRKNGESGGSDEGPEIARDKNGLYLVHHYWEDNRHVVIVNRKQIVQDEENPYWHGEKPYNKCTYQPLTGEFYGVGVVEMTADLQDELNTARRMRIDYTAMALRRMWKIRKGCGITAEDLVWQQGGVIEVLDPNDITEINVQQLPASAFMNEDNIKFDMRATTGAHDVVMGLSVYDETATTTMTKDANANMRFQIVVEAIVENLLVPIAKKCVCLDQQFLTEEKVIRVTKDEGAGELLHIDPEAISGSYDIIYVGSAIDPLASKELTKDRIVQAFSMLIGNQLYQDDTNAQIGLIKKLLEALEIQDLESVLPEVREFEGGDPTQALMGMLGGAAGPPGEAGPPGGEGQPPGLAQQQPEPGPAHLMMGGGMMPDD